MLIRKRAILSRTAAGISGTMVELVQSMATLQQVADEPSVDRSAVAE